MPFSFASSGAATLSFPARPKGEPPKPLEAYEEKAFAFADGAARDDGLFGRASEVGLLVPKLELANAGEALAAGGLVGRGGGDFERFAAPADAKGDAADANASKPLRFVPAGLSADEPGVEGAAMELEPKELELELLKELALEPKELELPKTFGPLTAENGEGAAAKAANPVPPCKELSYG
jgi:hypothetical protein